MQISSIWCPCRDTWSKSWGLAVCAATIHTCIAGKVAVLVVHALSATRFARPKGVEVQTLLVFVVIRAAGWLKSTRIQSSAGWYALKTLHTSADVKYTKCDLNNSSSSYLRVLVLFLVPAVDLSRGWICSSPWMGDEQGLLVLNAPRQAIQTWWRTWIPPASSFSIPVDFCCTSFVTDQCTDLRTAGRVLHLIIYYFMWSKKRFVSSIRFTGRKATE